MAVLTWVVAAMAFAGAILNVRKRPEGFLIWIVTNGAWAVHDFRIGEYAQAALWAAYFALSVWGFLAWRMAARKAE